MIVNVPRINRQLSRKCRKLAKHESYINKTKIVRYLFSHFEDCDVIVCHRIDKFDLDTKISLCSSETCMSSEHGMNCVSVVSHKSFPIEVLWLKNSGDECFSFLFDEQLIFIKPESNLFLIPHSSKKSPSKPKPARLTADESWLASAFLRKRSRLAEKKMLLNKIWNDHQCRNLLN